jgi:putative effector of murein hydrolase LrgA (UPF0299 family)
MLLSMLICIGALVWLVLLLRRDRVSLGLPLAYLYLLLLDHVPGAYAHWTAPFLDGSDATATGILFTAIGSVCFIAGVWVARAKAQKVSIPYNIDRGPFSKFCLLGGWFFVYGLSPISQIPSLGAAVEKGGALWMLGVMFGLRSALLRGDKRRAALWGSALLVYPVLMLLLGGFLSYGATAVIIVASILAISTVSTSRVMIGGALATFLVLNLFVNYSAHRDDIRDAVWGGAPMEQRIDAVLNIFREFSWIDSTNPSHLMAMHERLNQNYFVGVAADRIEHGEVDYLYGRSVWEGLLSLVPRAIWPDKPVFGGSPKIVREMTGLTLNENTSWGVGNVMEFHINFGIPGLIVGFLLLGWTLGTLDRRAAELDRAGDLSRIFFYFLPAVAFIQPIGSVVELSGGAAAALVAAFGWNWLWVAWSRRRYPSTKFPAQTPSRINTPKARS